MARRPQHVTDAEREVLRALNFRAGGLSKYCLGVAALEPAAKHNRFKPVLRRLDRIRGTPLLDDQTGGP